LIRSPGSLLKGSVRGGRTECDLGPPKLSHDSGETFSLSGTEHAHQVPRIQSARAQSHSAPDTEAGTLQWLRSREIRSPIRRGGPRPSRPDPTHPPSGRARAIRRTRSRERRLPSMTPSCPIRSSFQFTRSSSTYPPHGVSIGLWRFCCPGDGHIDCDLGDVGGISGGPREAVDDGG